MAFTPINWDENTLITPERLRHMEQQYQAAIDEASEQVRVDDESPLVVEVADEEPAGNTGRLYFNSTDGMIYGYDGDYWQQIGE